MSEVADKALVEFAEQLASVPEGHGFLDFYFGNPPCGDGLIHEMTPEQFVQTWEATLNFLSGHQNYFGPNHIKMQAIYTQAKTYLIALKYGDDCALLQKLAGETDAP